MMMIWTLGRRNKAVLWRPRVLNKHLKALGRKDGKTQAKGNRRFTRKTEEQSKWCKYLTAVCAGTLPCTTADSPDGGARHQHYRVRRQTVSGRSQRAEPPPPPPPPGPLAVLFLRLMAAVLSAETGPGHERQPRRTHGKPRREA